MNDFLANAACVAGAIGLTSVFFSPFWLRPAIGLLTRPQPLVLLVCDMLRIPQGWRDDRTYLKHETGIEFYTSFRNERAQYYFTLAVDGASVTLNAGDRLRLWQALKVFDKRQSDAQNELAARILAEKARAFAERARQHADNVVNIRGAA